MNTKVKLQVQGLTSSQIHFGTYALILAEVEGERHISITVGIAEAQAIAMALEQIVPPRPLTHDLIHSLFRMYDIHLLEVYIHKCEDDIFYSELLLEKNGQISLMDSRTSDAIAIALRMECDIYINEEILQNCGIEMMTSSMMMMDDDDDEEEDDDDDINGDDDDNFIMKDIEPDDIKDEAQLKKWLSLLRDSDLRYRMEKAVVIENYESAKIYKDELMRREKENGGKSK